MTRNTHNEMLLRQ